MLYKLYVARTAAAFAAVLAISVFLYGTFLLMAVQHTAVRTDAEQRIGAITSHLGYLELQYLAETKQMTSDRALALGFTVNTPESSVSTVFADADTHPLSFLSGYSR